MFVDKLPRDYKIIVKYYQKTIGKTFEGRIDPDYRIDSSIPINDDIDSFKWDYTEEGRVFWEDVYYARYVEELPRLEYTKRQIKIIESTYQGLQLKTKI